MNQYIGMGVVGLLTLMWITILAVNGLGSFVKDIVKAVMK